MYLQIALSGRAGVSYLFKEIPVVFPHGRRLYLGTWFLAVTVAARRLTHWASWHADQMGTWPPPVIGQSHVADERRLCFQAVGDIMFCKSSSG